MQSTMWFALLLAILVVCGAPAGSQTVGDRAVGDQTPIIEADWQRHVENATAASTANNHDEAVRQAEFALRLASTYFPYGDKRTVESLNLLGNVLNAAGRRREAEEQFRRATLVAEAPAVRSSAARDLGQEILRMGLYSAPVPSPSTDEQRRRNECNDLLAKAQPILLNVYRLTSFADLRAADSLLLEIGAGPLQAPGSAQVSDSVLRMLEERGASYWLAQLSRVAGCLRIAGRPEDSERLLRHSLAIALGSRARGPQYQAIAGTAARQLGNFLQAQFRHAEAVDLFRLSAAMPSASSIVPREDALHALSVALLDAGRYDEADACFQRWSAVAAAEGLSERVYLGHLARLRSVQGFYAEAEELAQKGTDRRRGATNPGSLNSQMHVAFADLGSIYYQRNDNRAAEQILNQALALLADPPDATAARVHATLGSLHRSAGNFLAADVAYERALAIYGSLYGEASPPYATVLSDVGYLRFISGSLIQADSRLTRALDILQSHFGTRHPSAGMVKWRLARLRQEQGKYGEAEEHYASAIEALTTAFVIDRPALAPLLSDYAAFLRLRKRPADALAVEKRARSVAALTKHFPGPAICRVEADIAGAASTAGR